MLKDRFTWQFRKKDNATQAKLLIALEIENAHIFIYLLLYDFGKYFPLLLILLEIENTHIFIYLLLYDFRKSFPLKKVILFACENWPIIFIKITTCGILFQEPWKLCPDPLAHCIDNVPFIYSSDRPFDLWLFHLKQEYSIHR